MSRLGFTAEEDDPRLELVGSAESRPEPEGQAPDWLLPLLLGFLLGVLARHS